MHRHVYIYAHTDPPARVPTHRSTQTYIIYTLAKVATEGVQIYLKFTVYSLQFLYEDTNKVIK